MVLFNILRKPHGEKRWIAQGHRTSQYVVCILYVQRKNKNCHFFVYFIVIQWYSNMCHKTETQWRCDCNILAITTEFLKEETNLSDNVYCNNLSCFYEIITTM